jgi:CheY-like chemotaxis protein
MDGIEATQKIIELNLNIPIVALTANIMTHDTALYKQTGMHDHLSKPFTSQELWRCLMKYFKPLSWQKENNEQILKDENKLREKLISNFVKSNKNFSQEISDAIKSDDIKLAHRLSHTLKGNAGQLHKTLLQRAAEDVEMQLVGGKNNLQPGQLDALKIELDTVLAEFAPMLEASSAAGEALSNEETLALFERLAPLLIDSNPEAGDYTDLLRQVKGCDELIQQIESFDFKPAVKTLAKLKKMLGE